MPVPFPAIKPSERDYTPPGYPVTGTKSQSGVTSKRLWGSVPVDAEMNLGFNVLNNDRIADLLQSWDATKSGIDYLLLPPEVLSGVGPRLAAIILPENGPLRWTFAERPSVSFIGPTWASARVRLIGELRLT